jgi:outer membrane protein OmpA-like peptidoglycan-associated protein
MPLSTMNYAISGISLVMLACASAQPSPALVDARRAYDDAAHGPALSAAPDKLLSARQALERAEAAHRNDAGSLEERSLAYVAQRSAAMAMTQADMVMAQRELDLAEQRYQRAQEARAQFAEASAARGRDALRENQAELERVRGQLSTQSDQLSQATQNLKKKEGELVARQKQLEGETIARKEAEKKAAAAMASLAEIGNVKEEQRGMVITLDGGVLFATAKATLLPVAEQRLAQVAEALQQQDDSKPITIEGHTDSMGTEEQNQRLSQERADAVRNFLIGKGVPSARIKSAGQGESRPIADNKTPEGRAMNRRVEIIVGR